MTQLTIQNEFDSGDCVWFIVNHELRQGVVVRPIFDGEHVRIEIAKEAGLSALWCIESQRVAKMREGGAACSYAPAIHR